MQRATSCGLGEPIYVKHVRPPPCCVEAILEIYEPEDCDGAYCQILVRKKYEDGLEILFGFDGFIDAEDAWRNAEAILQQIQKGK